MADEKKEEPKKDVAVDLECDDEFEEFGNEGARRLGEPASTSRARARSDLKKSAPAARSNLLRAHQNLSPLAPFVVAEWANEDEDAEDVQQWEEDWDDSDANDDFTKQLRAELDRFEQTKQ